MHEDEARAAGREKTARPKLLKPADIPDNFTRSLYKIAPYRGCAHGCRYCDGRAERYYVEGDFERDIEVRRAIPERLSDELPAVRERGMIAFGSGVTDPYQPLEAREKITGSCARQLAESPRALPALVMTKSSLVARDLPFWRGVNDRAGFVLLISLTSLDDGIRKILEPGASSFSERLETVRAFKASGCAVGILAMPFLPGLSDSRDSIRSLYEACVCAGVDFIMPGGLTLRPGRQKEFYIRALAAYRPDLVEPTLDLYRDERPSGAPIWTAARALSARIAPIRREFSIPFLLPHKVFARFLPPHDALRMLFRDMVELYAERSVDTAALKRSACEYDSWLVGIRRVFRRKRSLPDSWLEDRFNEATRDGELEKVLQNERLSRFVASVLGEGARLDYNTLKLEPEGSGRSPSPQ
jgi:DNA repair photolyase